LLNYLRKTGFRHRQRVPPRRKREQDEPSIGVGLLRGLRSSIKVIRSHIRSRNDCARWIEHRALNYAGGDLSLAEASTTYCAYKKEKKERTTKEVHDNRPPIRSGGCDSFLRPVARKVAGL